MRGRELPLWLWLAGYIEFLWHTAGPGLIPVGLISSLAFAVLATTCFVKQRTTWVVDFRDFFQSWRGLPGKGESILFFTYAVGFLLLTAIISLALFSALRPPFLPQEYDAINYQMGIPRQLLIRESLTRIDWSVADLWPMAMQIGMAPIFSAFGTINKLPQFLFALGAAATLYKLPKQINPNLSSPLLQVIPLLAIFGSHGVAIQLGTGMMDLPALYLLLLSISAAYDRRIFTAALSLAVYTASKAFHPFQIGAVVIAAAVWMWPNRPALKLYLKKFLPIFISLSVLLMARSTWNSLNASGTPLFPFFACAFAEGKYCADEKRSILEESASLLLATRGTYGSGRGLQALFDHFWRISVPTKGVNNEFDYPLGLPWLLLLVMAPFAIARERRLNSFLALAVLFWALWWMNSHQSRWLYPTLAFGFLGTIEIQKMASRLLPALVAVSLLFTSISQFRSLAPTIRLSPGEIRSREEEKIQWDDQGRLLNIELLYVNRPALDHAPGGRLWILR